MSLQNTSIVELRNEYLSWKNKYTSLKNNQVGGETDEDKVAIKGYWDGILEKIFSTSTDNLLLSEGKTAEDIQTSITVPCDLNNDDDKNCLRDLNGNGYKVLNITAHIIKKQFVINRSLARYILKYDSEYLFRTQRDIHYRFRTQRDIHDGDHYNYEQISSLINNVPSDLKEETKNKYFLFYNTIRDNVNKIIPNLIGDNVNQIIPDKNPIMEQINKFNINIKSVKDDIEALTEKVNKLNKEYMEIKTKIFKNTLRGKLQHDKEGKNKEIDEKKKSLRDLDEKVKTLKYNFNLLHIYKIHDEDYQNSTRNEFFEENYKIEYTHLFEGDYVQKNIIHFRNCLKNKTTTGFETKYTVIVNDINTCINLGLRYNNLYENLIFVGNITYVIRSDFKIHLALLYGQFNPGKKEFKEIPYCYFI